MHEGVSTSCSGSTICWLERRESWLQEEVVVLEKEHSDIEREALCGPTGVLGGLGIGQISSVGGTEKTTGFVESGSLLMSMTWMGADWLRKLTWYFF